MGSALSWSDRVARRVPPSTRARALVAGLAFGIVGGATALPIAWLFAFPAAGLSIGAALGASIVGGPLWWAVIERRDRPTLVRGGLVGAVDGVLAHPLMWLFASLVATVLEYAGVASMLALSSFAGGPITTALGEILILTVLGLIFTGIVTVPVAAGTGVVLAHVRRQVPDPGENDRRPRHL